MQETKAKRNRWRKLKDKSRAEFQVVVRNVQNYEELGSYKLTPLNLYLLVSTLLLVIAGLVYLLIAFTPLREYIPGYGNVVERKDLDELQVTVGELSELVEAQDLYINNLKRTVLGEAITADSIDQRDEVVIRGEVDALPPSEAEIRLRREMESERNGQAGQASAAPPPLPATEAVSLAQVYFVAPVNGEVSASFNLATEHMGVDILAPQNTAIKAARAGIVFMSEFTNANGNVIGIQHDNNLISFYKHNSQLLKQVGDRVKAGEAIAIIGNSGTQSTGPHLHFELWHEGRAVDPGEFISF
ncbi:murein DD-endopeptidase MepM/ murein hydrolase activator NlpD [Lewinella aquimaris]|uniref:Murein DD-endopeptidase MepM/ murein hydrolase activator NlpD n=1 Tax=Neolewinella aquimaris TaxID=1835722 RepID=A0A840EEG9_9BACT|nr:M23 family metallopeptidase [Neolewinella aquimaris]MBB4080199.1 murein DD-endopeptidase MepM/ murein hydrolase activator NlpD [Neolewinella aquimaris]